jgi:methyltransferase (TIGR00027 family)
MTMTRPTPSRTSQAVAIVRSHLRRPHSPGGESDAQLRLCAGMTGGRGMPAPLRAHLAARTRFVDRQVLGAIERGVHQIVVVGAGYDDRALRFRSRGVRFVELDHPSTQADKGRRLDRMKADLSGITLAPVDFRVDDVDRVLAGAGHARHRASLFVAEGLLVYLDEGTILGLLTGLRRRAATGSSLVVSLAVHGEGADSESVVAHVNAGRRHGEAEPWRTILPVRRHLDLLTESGWTVVESVDDAALGTGATPGRSLCAVALP